MYTRVTEIEEVNNKIQKPQLHKRAPRFGEPSFKSASSVKVGDASGRKRPFTKEKASNENYQPRKRICSSPDGDAENKVKLDPESDEDDVNGLLYRQAYKVLAPGGWLEHFEFNITLSSDIPALKDDEDHIFKQWTQVIFEATDRIGKTARIGMDGNMRKHMTEAGFVDIVENTYKGWARDRKLKNIGVLNKIFLAESLEGTALFLLREVLARECADIRQFVKRMRSVVQDTDLRSYCIMTNVYARKPESVL
ncbi:hypothetical protein QQZ08_008530 [Neonectria magnoliae]|uniref:Uncharacterized protein n=1 Tax=Neonectria magnoliae TaxID=2732573 RepID=A0ABR1HTU9_9HYPO